MTRKLDDWIGDERAVSPVIGVILMVAITVILAAVIGTFVLDLGQSAGQSAPQASLSVSVDHSADNVTIEHTGGDALNVNSTRVIVESPAGTETFNAGSTDLWSATLSVGESYTISAITSATFSSGDQVTVTIIDTESQRQIFETTVTA